MENAEKQTPSLLRMIGAALFYVIGLQVSMSFLEKVFSFDIALIISALAVSVIDYPLFMRGTVNIWTKDKRQWSFLSFMALMSIVIILVVLIANYLFPVTP